jgi:DNA-binding FadR family transcriptional regulator
MAQAVSDPAPAAALKVAEVLAGRVVDEIAALGWPVGRVLGTEPQLAEQYGVSRNVLRETIRLLEHLNVAHTREGRGGGLVVTQPQSAPVSKAAAIYLRYDGVDVRELYQARAQLESLIVEQAIVRLDDKGIAFLRHTVEEESLSEPEAGQGHPGDFHLALARVAGNRPMALFLDMLITLSDEYSRAELSEVKGEVDFAKSHRAHAAILQAVIGRDADVARRKMCSHLDAVQKWMP